MANASRKLVTLSPNKSGQQISKLANFDFIFLRPSTFSLSFQKAYLSKHFLISDCSMTSFYVVSALSGDPRELHELDNYWLSQKRPCVRKAIAP